MFVNATPEDRLVTAEEGLLPVLFFEFSKQDDAGKMAMFKMFSATGRYTISESVTMAMGLLILMQDGPEAFNNWVHAELEALT